MKKIFILLLILLISNFLFAQNNFNRKELIVRFTEKVDTENNKTGLTEFDNFLSKYLVKEINSIIEKSGLFIYKIRCSKNINFNELDTFASEKDQIIYTQPNNLNRMLSVIPNDPRYYQQWGLPLIKAPQTWVYEKGNEQIIIGLVDSGVDYNHIDLKNNIWINNGETGYDQYGHNKKTNEIDDDNNGYIDDWRGWDFTHTEMVDAQGDCRERDNDPLDETGHGSHCAGIFAAETNNSIGISGVSWFSKVMCLRAGFSLPSGGFLEDDDVSSAIIYAADNGAQIISISWGDPDYSPIIKDVCDYAYNMGVSIASSSGNDPTGQNDHKLFYPAALSTVISVGAIDEDLERCSFSCYGEGLDLVSPGLFVLSTSLNDDYSEMSGTSMSSPYVAGAIALLLSQNPMLSNYEIYNLLRNSCQDIGEDGYDNQYGYGLLDVNQLLQNEDAMNQAKAIITSPVYAQGINQDVYIYGTAFCAEFFRYTLMYTTEVDPEETQWLDITTHNPQPNPYYNTVINDTLGKFNISGLVDSTYYLKLSVQDVSGNKYVDIIKIYLDQTYPQFVENSIEVTTRYDFDKTNYYILAAAEEEVNFKATCFSPAIDSFSIIKNKFSDFAVLKLPSDLPNDNLSYFVEIKNRVNLTTTSDVFPDSIKIDNSTLPTYGYNKALEYYKGAYICPNKYDINHNGVNELVFMEFPEFGAYGLVNFAEKSNNELLIRYTIPTAFQPWSIGDCNGDGRYEIVGNIADSLIVFQSFSMNSFPDQFMYGSRSIGGLYGSVFYDLNGNGNDELLVNTVLDSQRTAYKIYKWVGQEFAYSNHWLLNYTPTISKNQLTARPQFGDFDNDGKLNILLSDIDGDIIIYEVLDNQLNIQIEDTLSIPIYNAYYSATGDFDGDGVQEFIVGGYNEDITNINNQLWLYCVFKYINNKYWLINYTEISGVSSSNGICAADLDGDNKDEIIITAAPDIYVYELDSEDFKPEWVGKSYRSYFPVSIDFDNNGIYDFVFNQYNDNDTLNLVVYSKDEYPPDVQTPQNFNAKPLNKYKVFLSWNELTGIDSLKIYRRAAIDTISLYLPPDNINYIDSTVLPDSTYYYSMSAFKDGEESYETLKQLVIPTNPPIVDSICMIALNALQIDFSTTMSPSCLNLDNYHVLDFGYPRSLIFSKSKTRLLLTFEDEFSKDKPVYYINLDNIEGYYNASMDDTTIAFNFEDDLVRPGIDECSLISSKEVDITFSETVKESTAINKENYQLLFPSELEDCYINSILYNDNGVKLTLSEKLKRTGDAYFIKANHIEDLAGNQILPSRNLIKIYIPIKDLQSVSVYPNPVNPENDRVFFSNLPTSGKVEIYIYDFAGEIIKKITKKYLSENDNTAEWNLKNASEIEVASGMYFYLINHSDNYERGKIAIIR